MTTRRDDVFISSTRRNAKIAMTMYRPETWSSPMPVIVMGHGIGAIKAGGLSPFAEAFNSAGYAAVTFDYLGFGASEGYPRGLLYVKDELQDFRDVLTWVRATEQKDWADDSNIVIWGTSFGGMHVTALMAEDHGLRAGIAQCPLVDGLAGSMQIPIMRAQRRINASVDGIS